MIDSSVMKELNQHLSIDSRNKKSMTNFWRWLWPYQINVDILQTFSTLKPILEAYLEPSRTLTIKLSCDFLERSSSIDVRMSSKCSSAYIYLQLSPIEIICILNIFAVKYIFSDKRRTKYSSSKWITGRFPGLDFILKLNAKYSAHFLPVGATKGFKGNRNSRYDIIRKIVSLEIQANPLMNLWSSSFQAKLHLSVDQELC